MASVLLLLLQAILTTTNNTPTSTATRDTPWTATIAGGRLEPDGGGWKVTGSVAINYRAIVTQDEEPITSG